MSRNELFMLILVTVVLLLNAARTMRSNPALAIWMAAIPVAGWTAIWLGK